METGPEDEKKKSILRLYVAGRTTKSRKAISNLEAICKEYLCDSYLIDIIDVLDDPIQALNDGVLVTPTLVRLSPPPVKTIVGDLSDRDTVLLALDLKEKHHGPE
jgi:circadian clock protein KaiB